MRKFLALSLPILWGLACTGGKDDVDDEEEEEEEEDEDEGEGFPGPGTTTTGGGGGGGGSGTGVYDGPTFIDYVEMPWCQTGDTEIVFYGETTGWTDGANLLNIFEQQAPAGNRWHEEHDLVTVAFDEMGWWDAIEQIFSAGTGYTRNEESFFWCAGGIPDHGLVYVVRVYDLNGNYADCAIFEEPGTNGIDEVLSGDTDADRPGFIPVSDPNEISAANCEVWD